MCKRSDPYILKVTIWPIMLLAAGCLWSSGTTFALAQPDLTELLPISIQPVTDTWIAEAYPNSACGDKPYLVAGYDMKSETPGRIRSLVKFDLTGLPEGASVTQARLFLYYAFSYGPTTGESTISAARLIGPWAENSAHWDAAPGIADGEPANGSVNHAMPGTWITMDLTQMAQGWAQGEYPNYGIVLIGPEEISMFSSSEYFGSGESNNPPRLEITYQLPEPHSSVAETPTIPVYLPLLFKDFPPVISSPFAYLVIAIGDYGKMPAPFSDDARLGYDLRYPIFDATDIQDMLEVYGNPGGNPAGQVLALKDRYATKQGIQDAITGWLDAHEDKDTTVMIYFAGHTLVQNNKPYLAPHNLDCAPCTDLTDPSNWLASSAISAEEINTWLGNLASTHFIFVFDSPGSERWIAELKGTDRTILAGSRISENRWEFQDVQNGAFSYYFNQAYVEGANLDPDSEISITEVNNFTLNKNPKLATFVYNHTIGAGQQHTVLNPGAYSKVGFMSIYSVQACPSLP